MVFSLIMNFNVDHEKCYEFYFFLLSFLLFLITLLQDSIDSDDLELSNTHYLF